MPTRTALALLSFLAAGLALAAPPEPRRIEVVARKFSFDPAKIEVKAGESVEITFTSVDTKHGFVCKELGLEKVVFRKGAPATVRLTAEKPGTYEFKCARFCGLGHGRMKGAIVVVP
jgi:cytochrome c oxidase subunit 2